MLLMVAKDTFIMLKIICKDEKVWQNINMYDYAKFKMLIIMIKSDNYWNKL